MNRAFEKILERLRGLAENYGRLQLGFSDSVEIIVGKEQAIDLAIEIVQEVAKEYKGGWIPCSERLPSGLDFVLYTHKDGEVDICSIEYFYDYLDKFTAWQPLPERFKEGE